MATIALRASFTAPIRKGEKPLTPTSRTRAMAVVSQQLRGNCAVLKMSLRRPTSVQSSQRRRLCVCAAESVPKKKMPIRDLNNALKAAGIDTSSMFERSELEEKFNLLTPDQQNFTSTAASGQGTTESSKQEEQTSSHGSAQASSDDSSSAGTSSDGSSSAWSESVKEAMASFFNGPVQQLIEGPKKVWGSIQNDFTSGAVVNKARVFLTGLDAQLKVGETLNKTSAVVRERLISIDYKIKLSETVKREGPPILAKVNEFRQTQIGRTASTFFGVWFIFSGALWSSLSFSFPFIVLSNWIFPGALSNAFKDVIENVQQRTGMGGQGGGFDPSSMGQGSGGSQQQRGDQGTSSSPYGPVVDVEVEKK